MREEVDEDDNDENEDNNSSTLDSSFTEAEVVTSSADADAVCPEKPLYV